MYKLKDSKLNLHNERRKKLKDITLPPVTIISNTCLGGRLYFDYNSKFLSPTIDMYIKPDDFVKFCKNLEYYINCKPVKSNEVLVGFNSFSLDDILIFYAHTNDSFEKASEKFIERSKRIVWDNIKVICTDRVLSDVTREELKTESCSDEVLKSFLDIPYNKVMFTVKDTVKDECICYLPTFKNEKGCPEATKPSLSYMDKYIVEEDGFDLDKFVLG